MFDDSCFYFCFSPAYLFKAGREWFDEVYRNAVDIRLQVDGWVYVPNVCMQIVRCSTSDSSRIRSTYGDVLYIGMMGD